MEQQSRAVLQAQLEIIEQEVRKMSAFAMRTVRRWWGLALPIVVAAAAAAGMVLVAGAATGDKAGPSPADAVEPRGAVRDAGVNPWEANDPALVPRVDSTAGFATGYGRPEVEWTQTGIGAVITQEDGSTLLVAAIENSVDGPGAAVAKLTLDGDRGTQRATRYTANGVLVGDEELTLGAADADGKIPVTGSGECVKGGTRVHKKERCSYTFTGTLDSTTNVVTFEITGTSTR